MQTLGRRTRSPWFYAGLILGVLLVLGLGVAALTLIRALREDTDTLIYTQEQLEQALKILGARKLPEDYVIRMVHPSSTDEDTVLLSDHPYTLKGFEGGTERFLLYVHLRKTTQEELEALREYLDGRAEDSSVLSRIGVIVSPSELLGRGTLQLEGGSLLYRVQRGGVASRHFESNGTQLSSIVLFECPGSLDIRAALWVAPDPSPGTSGPKPELKGTPADPEALRALLPHLNPCLDP